MILIESNKQLQQLLSSRQQFKLIFPVYSSYLDHELASTISFIYCHTGFEKYIININHIDADKVTEFKIEHLIDNNTAVYNKRYYNTECIDYELLYFEEYGTPFIFSDYFDILYKNYKKDFENINDCIPLLKWVELLSKLPILECKSDWVKTYSKYITELGRIEESGVEVDTTYLPNCKTYNGLAYTKYNPYTITGRPSNRHGGINWSALNKSDGTRKGIISRWNDGKLISMDFESYHIRLIAKLIGYELPTDKTAHQYFAEIYGVDYEESKAITFRYLYGGMDEGALKIPFFKLVNEWIEKLWKDFVIRGYIETPIFKRKISFKRIESPTQTKVFNYLLQALETEINYKKISELNEYLVGKKSKIILYTYDAILMDINSNEQSIVNDVIHIMQRGGFPIRAYVGTNYADLILFE